MQLLWLFSAFALIGAVASARGDCTQLPTFLEENDEGEPKIAAAMKEECAISFTGTELTECRKCANKIAAAIFSAEDLEERITKIYGEVMVYTNNGANTTRFSFVDSMLRKYWGSFDQLQACAGMSAIVANLLLLGDQITPQESYEKAEQCDSSCAQNPLCVGSNYFPNQTCHLFSSLTSRQQYNAVGVRSYFKDYTAICKTPPAPKPYDCTKRKDVLATSPNKNVSIIVASMMASYTKVFATDVTSMIACVNATREINESIWNSDGQPDATRIEPIVAILKAYQLKGEKADAFLKAEIIDTWLGTYQDFMDC